MTRPTIDELEMLNPFELGDLLINEVIKPFSDVQFIQDLLDVGCPIDARGYGGWTPLHCAVYFDKLNLVKVLVAKGSDVNIEDVRGWTAWGMAHKSIREVVPELKPQ